MSEYTLDDVVYRFNLLIDRYSKELKEIADIAIEGTTRSGHDQRMLQTAYRFLRAIDELETLRDELADPDTVTDKVDIYKVVELSLEQAIRMDNRRIKSDG